MSTVYISDIPFEEVLKLKEVESLTKPLYTVRHAVVRIFNNRILVFEGYGEFGYTNGCAMFERFGRNNPTAIFNMLMERFPNSSIRDENTRIEWPECGEQYNAVRNSSRGV